MRRLAVFNNISLDGYFVDTRGEMSWAHNQDEEWRNFAAENAKGGGELLFGRITYEMMASFWPSPAARQMNPAVAEGMNNMRKVVFSRTLRQASWNNTRLLQGDLGMEVRKLKNESGPDMVILGSGSIVSQLAQEGLIDEYQVVVHPIVLCHGRTLFEGGKDRIRLTLSQSRAFGNGNVVLYYKPVALDE